MNNKKIKIASVLLVVFILIGIISGIYITNRKSQLNDYNSNISQLKNDSTKVDKENKKSKNKSKLDFKTLNKINPDVKGWLTVPNTQIDTPITQTKNNSFYLKHNFYKNYSFYGNAFLDYRCKDDSQIKVIYGHNMRDTAQFGTLQKLYKSPERARKNPMITYETSSGKSEWIVIGAYYTTGDKFADSTEKLRKAFDSKSVTSFDEKTEQLNKLKNKFIYSSNIVFDEYDNYMELYTCSYHKKGQRFVVVAREKRENEYITNINYYK